MNPLETPPTCEATSENPLEKEQEKDSVSVAPPGRLSKWVDYIPKRYEAHKPRVQWATKKVEYFLNKLLEVCNQYVVWFLTLALGLWSDIQIVFHTIKTYVKHKSHSGYNKKTVSLDNNITIYTRKRDLWTKIISLPDTHSLENQSRVQEQAQEQYYVFSRDHKTGVLFKPSGENMDFEDLCIDTAYECLSAELDQGTSTQDVTEMLNQYLRVVKNRRSNVTLDKIVFIQTGTPVFPCKTDHVHLNVILGDCTQIHLDNKAKLSDLFKTE